LGFGVSVGGVDSDIDTGVGVVVDVVVDVDVDVDADAGGVAVELGVDAGIGGVDVETSGVLPNDCSDEVVGVALGFGDDDGDDDDVVDDVEGVEDVDDDVDADADGAVGGTLLGGRFDICSELSALLGLKKVVSDAGCDGGFSKGSGASLRAAFSGALIFCGPKDGGRSIGR